MPWMALRRIAPPEQQEIGPILDLPERASDLAHPLKCHPGRTVAHRCRRVHVAADPVGNRHGHALRFARGIRQAIRDRKICVDENSRRPLDGVVEGGRLPFDRRHRAVVDMVVEKPRLAEDARVLGLGDRVAFDRQLHVVAYAPAKSAGGVRDDAQLGGGGVSGCVAGGASSRTAVPAGGGGGVMRARTGKVSTERRCHQSIVQFTPWTRVPPKIHHHFRAGRHLPGGMQKSDERRDRRRPPDRKHPSEKVIPGTITSPRQSLPPPPWRPPELSLRCFCTGSCRLFPMTNVHRFVVTARLRIFSSPPIAAFTSFSPIVAGTPNFAATSPFTSAEAGSSASLSA